MFSGLENGILIKEASAAAASTKRRGRVVEILYDPNLHEVPIDSGENVGRVFVHRNIVKSIKDLGKWEDGQEPVSLPRRDISDGLERVLMVQEGLGGRIIGVAQIPF